MKPLEIGFYNGQGQPVKVEIITNFYSAHIIQIFSSALHVDEKKL